MRSNGKLISSASRASDVCSHEDIAIYERIELDRMQPLRSFCEHLATILDILYKIKVIAICKWKRDIFLRTAN